MNVELVAKIQQGAQLISDACQEWLEYHAPADRPKWDPDKVSWKETRGTKGPYQLAEPQAKTDFKNMLADVKAHKGRLWRDNFFYWVFRDQARVGRKHKPKQKTP